MDSVRQSRLPSRFAIIGTPLSPQGDGWLESSRIHVEDGYIARIEAMGASSGAPRAPDDAQTPVFDMQGCYLIPGLIDCHTHLSLDLTPSYFMSFAVRGVADFALAGARNALRTLRSGVTMVRDLGSVDFVDVALSRAIAHGDVAGPRVLPCGHILTIPGGNGDITGFRPGILEKDWRAGVVSGPEEVSRSVRYQVKHGAKVIKIAASGGVIAHDSGPLDTHMTDAEIRAAVDTARLLGCKVAAHAHSPASVRACLEAGVSTIEHGTLMSDEECDLMARTGTILVPTTYVLDCVDSNSLPSDVARKFDQVRQVGRGALERAMAKGVRIAFGSDAGVIPHGENVQELDIYAALGMSPAAVLAGATTLAAETLGYDDVGTLAVGKRADLVALAQDPLQSVSALHAVRAVFAEAYAIERF